MFQVSVHIVDGVVGQHDGDHQHLLLYDQQLYSLGVTVTTLQLRSSNVTALITT